MKKGVTLATVLLTLCLVGCASKHEYHHHPRKASGFPEGHPYHGI